MERYRDWFEENKLLDERCSAGDYEAEDEYGYPVLRKRRRTRKKSTPVERRAWWRDMDAAAKAECSATVAHFQAYREQHAELEIVNDAFSSEKPTLVQIGQYVGSRGTYVQKEEYIGQRRAYQHCRTITEYLGKFEQLDLLNVLRFGLLKGWLTFRVPELKKQQLVEGACCFDFSVISVDPYFDEQFRVIIDATIEADLLFLTEPTCPFCTVKLFSHTTKEQYRVRVELRMDGSLRLVSIKRCDQLTDEDKVAKWWRLDQILVPVVSAEQAEDFADMLYKALRQQAGRIDSIAFCGRPLRTNRSLSRKS